MKTSDFLLSFRNTILWLVLLAAIMPVSIISPGLIGKIHKISREAALKEVDILAENISAKISHQIDLTISMLKGLASNRDIALATRRNSIGIGHYLGGRAPEYLQRNLESFSVVSDIYLTDINASITVSVHRKKQDEGKGLHGQAYAEIKKLMESVPNSTEKFITASYSVMDIMPDGKEVHETYIVIIIPVILDITSTLQGALAAVIPLSSIKEFSGGRNLLDAGMDFTIYRNESLKEAKENDGILERNALLSIPSGSGNEPLKFVVKIFEPSEERFRYVDKALIDLVLFQIAIILVIVLIVYMLARRMTFSLQTLNNIVSHYAAGDYSYTGRSVYFIELQSIIDVLGKMGQRIIEQISGLKQAEQKYRSIFENVNEGIFQAAPTGHFISANPAMASLLGYDSESDLIESVNNIALELFTDREARKDFFQLIEISEKITGFETPMKCKTGEIIWVSMSVRIVKDAGGKPVYYEGSILDITQSRAAEEEILKLNKDLENRVSQRTTELEKTNKALSESLIQLRMTHKQLVQSEKMAALGNLVAGIAHEINTPVGIGVTATSFLEKQTEEINKIYADGKMTRTDLAKYLETVTESSAMILSNLQRAADLISSFKKIAVDQSCEEKRSFRVKEYMEEIIMSLQPKLKRTRHSIKLECPDDLEIFSFPGAFSQIFTNLVINSLVHAFTPDDAGVMTIHILDRTRMIEMIYDDNGRGMTEDVLKMIFDPFFTTNRAEGGTGLGMHIVYNLVTQSLKGDIKCYSSPGKGTRFIIKIPFSQRKAHLHE